jgi:hypothetical protein
MTTLTKIEQPEINTLEAEGFILAAEWKKICKADVRRFNAFTKADGFDTRLGKLLQQLKAEGGQRISSQRLKDCGIHVVDKRRRSEALWFVENEVEARQFIAESKKGFTSLSALQKAMAVAAKPKAQADATTEQASQGLSNGEVKSDVGPSEANSEAAAPSVVSKAEIVKQLKAVCKKNDINILDVIDDILAEYADNAKTIDSKAA